MAFFSNRLPRARGSNSPVGSFLRVIFAQMLRDNQERMEHPAELLLDLSEPVVLATVFCLVRYVLDHLSKPPLGSSIVLFYATGFFPDFFWIYVGRRMRGSVSVPRQRFPVEQRLDQIIAHVLMRGLDYLLLGIVVFGAIYLFVTPMGWPYKIEYALVACIAIATLGAFWGIVTMVLIARFWWWAYVVPFINRAFALMSGAFFLPDFLSPGARYIISFNPMAQAISLFRSGFYPGAPSVIFDSTYLLECCLFSLFFGFLIERMTRRSEVRVLR